MLIVLGAQAQVSVGKLFLAAIAPGLLLSASYLIYILIVTLRNPKLGPPLSKEEAQQMPVKKRIVGSIIYLSSYITTHRHRVRNDFYWYCHADRICSCWSSFSYNFNISLPQI